MTRSTLRSIAAALTLASGLSAAHATPVSYTFSAVVSTIGTFNLGMDSNVDEASFLGYHIAVGDRLVGTLTYDVGTAVYLGDQNPGEPADILQYHLPTYTLQYSLLSGGYGVSAIGGYAQTSDYGSSDYISISSHPFIHGPEVTIKNDVYMSFQGQNLLDHGTLPADLLTPGYLPNLSGGFQDFYGVGAVSFETTMLSFEPVVVAAVPEPTTSLMLLAGLGALGAAVRRQRRVAAA